LLRSPRQRLQRSRRSTPSSCIQRRLPMCQVCALHHALRCPALARRARSSAASGAMSALLRSRCHHGARQGVFAAACTPAAAASTAPLRLHPPPAPAPPAAGWPTVSVPVLSKATVSTRCASSSACASLIRMPCCAATPVPAMMAAGVASPSAQGQAITSTATAWISAASVPAPPTASPAA
jgi:hypothetical protein